VSDAVNVALLLCAVIIGGVGGIAIAAIESRMDSPSKPDTVTCTESNAPTQPGERVATIEGARYVCRRD
jgi:cell division protein FtsN